MIFWACLDVKQIASKLTPLLHLQVDPLSLLLSLPHIVPFLYSEYWVTVSIMAGFLFSDLLPLVQMDTISYEAFYLFIFLHFIFTEKLNSITSMC